MKNLLLIGTTFLATPFLILLCVISLFYLESRKDQQKISHANSKIAFAALPSTQNLLSDKVDSEDARVGILSRFFKKYKSDLLPFVTNIVSAADRYGLDYRLLPSIAMQESNLCKKIPKDSYNCWGYAIYGKNIKRFDSYPKAIEAVSQTLAADYIGRGLVAPEDIMRKYTPGSNGSWAQGVNHFMTELENTPL